MPSERFEMRVPGELMKRLDEARGYEARASFVKRALESALENASYVETGAPGLGESGVAERVQVPASVSSRAPDLDDAPEVAEALSVSRSEARKMIAQETVPASSRQAFKCPDSKCGFRAFSAKAVCGNHGRVVVPA